MYVCEEAIDEIWVLGCIIYTGIIFNLSYELASLSFISELEKRLLYALSLPFFSLLAPSILVLDCFKFQIPTDFTKFTHCNGVHVAWELNLVISHLNLSTQARVCIMWSIFCISCLTNVVLFLPSSEVGQIPVKNSTLFLIKVILTLIVEYSWS